jgi:hypothetical protein
MFAQSVVNPRLGLGCQLSGKLQSLVYQQVLEYSRDMFIFVFTKSFQARRCSLLQQDPSHSMHVSKKTLVYPNCALEKLVVIY